MELQEKLHKAFFSARSLAASLAVLAAAVVLLAPAARASTIEVVSSETGLSTAGFYGVSFSTPGGGPWDALTFAFISPTGLADYASGTGFILSQPYTGAPSGLSSATAGFVGSVGSAGNFYTFAPGLTLASGTTYYFYENGLTTAGKIGVGPGGDFTSSGSNTNFAGGSQSLNFIITGTSTDPPGVPEPGSLSLITLAIPAVWFLKRRKA